jgi:hypothetical protein
MAERTNALVLKTSGGDTPVGSNPTPPARRPQPALLARIQPILNLLKIIKIMETFAFGFCTLWVRFSVGEGIVGRLEDGVEKEDWMKRAIFLATAALLVMLILAPVALAQEETTMPGGETTAAAGGETTGGALAPSGGPAILLPAAALLLGSGVLTYAILRRR